VRLGAAGIVRGRGAGHRLVHRQLPAGGVRRGAVRRWAPSVDELLADDGWERLVPRSQVKGDTRNDFASARGGGARTCGCASTRTAGWPGWRVHGTALPDRASWTPSRGRPGRTGARRGGAGLLEPFLQRAEQPAHARPDPVDGRGLGDRPAPRRRQRLGARPAGRRSPGANRRAGHLALPAQLAGLGVAAAGPGRTAGGSSCSKRHPAAAGHPATAFCSPRAAGAGPGVRGPTGHLSDGGMARLRLFGELTRPAGPTWATAGQPPSRPPTLTTRHQKGSVDLR